MEFSISFASKNVFRVEHVNHISVSPSREVSNFIRHPSKCKGLTENTDLRDGNRMHEL